MSGLENIVSGQLIERIGWTLVHFVWQGCAAAAVLAVVLLALRKRSANVRYLVSCFALAAMVVMPVVTICRMERPETVLAAARVENIAPMERREQLPGVAFAPVEKGVLPAGPVLVREVEAPVMAAAEVSFKDKFVSRVEASLPFVVVGWIVGVAGLSLWYLGGWTQLQRMRRRMVKPVGAELRERLANIAERVGVSRAVELMESALVSVPVVIGWLKPVILVPASAVTGLDGEQLEALLAHELAHIKRCDYLVNILQTIVEILGFYHPAVWWVSHRIRVEREMCCDDMAVGVCGDSVRYAKALASIAESHGLGGNLAVAASGGSLLERVRRLVLKESAHKSGANWGAVIVAGLLALAILVPAGFAVSSRLKDKNAIIAKRDEGGAQFKYTLSNGVTVELIGICEHPSEGKQWWRPDGTLLDEDKRPYERFGVRCTSAGHRVYEAASRFSGGGSEKVSISIADIGMGVATYQGGIQGQAFWASAGETSVDMKVRVGSGPWQTDFEGTRPSSNGMWGVTSFSSGSAVFGKPFEDGDKTWVAVSYNIDADVYDIRVVAVDKEGNETESSGSSSMGAGGFIQATPGFDVPLESVEKFRLQTRPYEWVEFKNVSLRAGEKRAVEVAGEGGEVGEYRGKGDEAADVGGYGGSIAESEEGGARFKYTLSNGVTVELVGLHQYLDKDKRWWRPDGKPMQGAPYEESPTWPHIGAETGRIWYEAAILVRGFDAEDGAEARISVTDEQCVSPVNDGKSDSSEQMYSVGFVLAEDVHNVEIRAGVACGGWETRGDWATNNKSRQPRFGILWYPAEEEAGAVSIDAIHSFSEYDCRVVAVTKRGDVRKGIYRYAMSGDIVDLRSEFEDVAISDIEQFQFQTRPYEWVEFGNVSLRAGEMPEVKVGERQEEASGDEGLLKLLEAVGEGGEGGSEESASRARRARRADRPQEKVRDAGGEEGFSEFLRAINKPAGQGSEEFAVRLPNGTRVELVGVLGLGDKGLEAWKADGTRTQMPGVLEADIDGYDPVVALKVTGEDVSFRMRARGGMDPMPMNSMELLGLKDMRFYSLGNLGHYDSTRYITLYMPDLESGPWKETLRLPLTKEGLESDEAKKKILEEHGIGISHYDRNLTDMLRIVFTGDEKLRWQDRRAIDKSGRLYEGRIYHQGGMSIAWEFKLSPDELAGLVYGGQDTAKVTFRNISLRAGQGAEVVVESEFFPVEAVGEEGEKKNGLTVSAPAADFPAGVGELPEGWVLDFDDGIGPEPGTRRWRPAMAFDLAELVAIPDRASPAEAGTPRETYSFSVRSLQGKKLGAIEVGGRTSSGRKLILAPGTYLVTYGRGWGENPDNGTMKSGPYLLKMDRAGMYELKFNPHLGGAKITGSLGGCYALNYSKVGEGSAVGGGVYQYPSKEYSIAGVPPGTYQLSGVRQRDGSNVFVSLRTAVVQGEGSVTADINEPQMGDCSLAGTILGRLSTPREEFSSDFEWYVLIRKAGSKPVKTTGAYECMTMDSLYVVRGGGIRRVSEEKTLYNINGILPGIYTMTVIEYDLWAGAEITRQQSQRLEIRAGEHATLDFDMRASDQDLAPADQEEDGDVDEENVGGYGGVSVRGEGGGGG